MEGFFAALQYLEDNPAVAALIEVATLAAILIGFGVFVKVAFSLAKSIKGVAKDAEAGRGKIHKRIDETSKELGEKIEQIAEDQRDHEHQDVRVLAKIGTALEFLVADKGGPQLNLERE